MLETPDLFLAKAKFSDWQAMYRNVWSQAQCAQYMAWNLTDNETDAQARILRTIEFQKIYDTYFIYEKKSNEAIGFAGFEKINDEIYAESGICLGTDYVGRGYGKQILRCLIEHCKNEFGAKQFLYSSRGQNIPSIRLAESLGFTLVGSEKKIDKRNGQEYILLKYSLDI